MHHLLKKIIVLFCLFLSVMGYGQANKTLKDSVFQKGDIIRFPHVVFALSNPCCWGEQLDSIELVANFLKQRSELHAEVAVHMSCPGTPEMNDRLSDFRARHVWNALVVHFKVDSSQVKYKGYGENKLLISQAQIKKAKTNEEKQKLHNINIRMELIVKDIKLSD
jgi:outer membrane protein OmpA-like peptidoglycan-associated protein